MEQSIPLRFLLSKEILSAYSSISQFATKSGLSRSTLSLIFKQEDPKPISFEHLVKITLTLGYPEQHFFDLYIQEYFTKENFNRSRIEKLLKRCGKLGLTHHLLHVIERLEDNAYYVPVVFNVAEELSKDGMGEAASLLYDWIVTLTTEIPQSLLATCHYRIFRSAMSLDSDLNLKILYRFLPFYPYLPTHLYLDASINALHILYNQRKFEELDVMSDKFILFCIQLFGTANTPNFKAMDRYKNLCERHPVVYYGQAYLAKQCALEGFKKYREAQAYCNKYGELRWFDDGSEAAHKELSKFAIFAQANFWNFELLQGNMNVLPDYTAFLEDHPEELIPGLITILESANAFNFPIDYFVERFEHKLEELLENPDGYYTEIAKRNNLSYLLYHLAIYHSNAGRIQKSLTAAMKCWNMSQTVNNQQHFRLLASLTAFYNMYDESII
ncbi:helix-turn-helix domain-containing protein [Saccharibacillus sacchari]|uniref:helix-turn-helix domain-containing protein n=1 Tax=Saccharibacillus sacchari TaxID=456493 RepID=UPI0004B93A86|nr:hypothetical protein [Saccharibacillus sacchari]